MLVDFSCSPVANDGGPAHSPVGLKSPGTDGAECAVQVLLEVGVAQVVVTGGEGGSCELAGEKSSATAAFPPHLRQHSDTGLESPCPAPCSLCR